MSQCAKLTARKGKPETYENLDNNNVIRDLNGNKCSYQGYDQRLIIDQRTTKDQLYEMIKERVRKVHNSELTGKIRSKLLTCRPTMSYSFGAIKWSRVELEKTNRTIMWMENRPHHLTACAVRIYLPTKVEGNG